MNATGGGATSCCCLLKQVWRSGATRFVKSARQEASYSPPAAEVPAWLVQLACLSGHRERSFRHRAGRSSSPTVVAKRASMQIGGPGRCRNQPWRSSARPSPPTIHPAPAQHAASAPAPKAKQAQRHGAQHGRHHGHHHHGPQADVGASLDGAADVPCPWLRNWLAKSTIRMPFLAITPTSSTRPDLAVDIGASRRSRPWRRWRRPSPSGTVEMMIEGR